MFSECVYNENAGLFAAAVHADWAAIGHTVNKCRVSIPTFDSVSTYYCVQAAS